MEQINDLTAIMSNEDLLALKAKYKGNESIAKLVDSAIATRKIEADKAKELTDFSTKVEKLAKLPTPPATIHNIYLAWKEVVENVGKPELVKVVGQPDEMRQATIKVYKWIVEVNKAFTTTTGKSIGTSAKTAKRAIQVFKREGLNLVSKGIFASATKACTDLKLEVGGDSASRVLAREGYIVEGYEGELPA